MDTQAGMLSRRHKNAIRATAFLVTFIALVVIPFGVMYGRLGPSWMLLANVLFCVSLAVIAIGTISWVFMRVRNLRRK